MTFFSSANGDYRRLADALRRNRAELGSALYSALLDESCATWKSAPSFENLEEWGRSQLFTAVELLEARFATGDALLLQLFAGWIHSRIATGLSAEGVPPDYKPDRVIPAIRESWTRILGFGLPTEVIRLLASELDRAASLLSSPVVRKQRILFIGDCLQFEVMTSLVAPCVQAGIAVEPTLINERVQPVLRNRIRAFSPKDFDLVYFSPFSHTYLPEYEALLKPRRVLWSAGKIGRHAKAMVEEAFLTADTIAQQFDCPVYIHNTSGTVQVFGRASGLAKSLVLWRNCRQLRRHINGAVKHCINERRATGVKLLDESALRAGAERSRLGRIYLQSHAFHPTRLGVELGRGPYFDSIYCNAFLATRKAVVCDLDNTLWDGIIGEGAVSHHLDRQILLKELRRRGVLLAIISKNDEKNVHWSGAALQPDDFVAARINWSSKTSNMAAIRDELNLKLKDFVFIDDRPDELDRMRNAFPEILGLDATRPETWNFLAQWGNLLPPEPEQDRTMLYHERVNRERFVSAIAKNPGAPEDETAALDALELSVKIGPIAPSDLKRTAELINRTNQFNVCGSRATERELADGLSKGHVIVKAEASDKFGSMGVVGIMKLDPGPGRIEIPIFVLSCRAFGFGIEYALLNAVRCIAPDDCLVVGRYKETQYNGLCRQFYSASGMTGNGAEWSARADQIVPTPAWLKMKSVAFPIHSTSAAAAKI